MRLYLILLIVFLFISGCAQQITDDKGIYSDWKSRINKQNTWKANGKIAFINTNERQSANFTWKNNGDKHTPNFKLKLTTFIGTQILSVSQEKNKAQLDYDGKTYFDTSAQNMLNRLTNISFPVSDAPSWLKGRPKSNNIKFDDLDRVQSARIQDNKGEFWHVTYNQYAQTDGFWLPRKMSLVNRDLKIKMQIHSWQITQ
ncbi:lipoprotein insertase outer membrane protein LolB [Pseudoalteromonas denitrificans]|uniref:Outer-membrane lipoprotein LolB n=1 Tax=Pseudoalteromonas denitrificans DSM 6059 TaxID=1123010 RepID=A0A1I1TCP6_9GAMM|nr:lipoprotein insertase outer membrane protein LolB [Pseudoalteromonas denitrificans]SFD56359.1 outer membrane lipoprotein LolB [Pseudoalteromonas denitrificans DSM 6059]